MVVPPMSSSQKSGYFPTGHRGASDRGSQERDQTALLSNSMSLSRTPRLSGPRLM